MTKAQSEITWYFDTPESILPEVVVGEECSATPAGDGIVFTPYTGCAWCGDGDGNGMCASCEELHFPPRRH